MERGEEGRGVATAARRARPRSVLRAACCLTAAVLDGRGARRARRVKLLGGTPAGAISPESEVR